MPSYQGEDSGKQRNVQKQIRFVIVCISLLSCTAQVVSSFFPADHCAR
jgi:hypothetical protein